MTKLNVVAASLVLLVLAAVPVLAHHSFSAEFDANKPVSFTGTVTKIEWTNPHSWFYIDVKDAQTGKTENWGFETGNPVALVRQGWTRDTKSRDGCHRRRHPREGRNEPWQRSQHSCQRKEVERRFERRYQPVRRLDRA